MKRKQFFTVSAALLCLITFAVLMLRPVQQLAVPTGAGQSKSLSRVVIDAGHGGEDGGAVVGKVLEKDINLAVACDLADLLTLCGFEAVMTRGSDTALSSEGEDVRQRKYNDMKRRLELFNESERNVIISVHQNKFSSAQSHGAQVFYSPNHPDSAFLADCIKSAVKAALQPDNERATKAAGKEIYLLKNTQNPAVLVECGFLSNSAERQKLMDASYQKQMATAIAEGFLNYYQA